MNGKLVFIKSGKKTVLEYDKPFALLNQIRNRIKKDAQYFGGVLKLEYVGTK